MSNITDTSGIKGVLKFTVKDKFGNVKKLWNENFLGRFIRTKLGFDLQGVFFLGRWKNNLSFHNLITSAGLAGQASRLNGSGAEAAFTYLALGTGTTAANVADTTLETEITDSGLARSAATCSRTQTTVANDTAKLSKTWTATGSKNVSEVGTLNASSAGTLIGRQVFSAISLVNTNSFQIDYSFVMTAA